jgi:elongation factor 2
MVNFTVDEIRRMMNYRNNIRCLSVIAHVDHGKSTLTDSLIGHAGIIAQAKAGDTRFMDTRKDEQDRTITIKSTGVSLYFEMDKQFLAGKPLQVYNDFTKEQPYPNLKAPENSPYLINLIDSPGHVDFSSEVTAALRVTDGALVVVDCVEGVCVQTETVLRQAIGERIKPILFVNKLDRIFLELQMDGESAFQSFRKAVESVNVVIEMYKDEGFSDCQVVPEMGTVGFGSGLHGWGFNLNRFARMYAAKFGVAQEKMMNKLWGDNFFDAEAKKWVTRVPQGKNLKRAFVQFIFDPINTLIQAIIQAKVPVYTKMLAKLQVEIPKDAKELVGKPLLKRVMQTWLPAAESLLMMIVNHLPSPVDSQRYRCAQLYPGPQDDPSAIAIQNCDPEGPLMMYISKMVPTSEKGRFYAFGRVFSGTVATGQEVRIYGPEYTPGQTGKKDLFIKKIQRTVLMMGRYVEQLADAPCGNTIGLVGIDTYLLKSGTICTHPEAHPIVTMKYSVSPVVRVAVDVKNASDLPKLMEGLKRLAKSDPLVLCFTAKTGEHIVAGAGELHLEICLKDLAEDFMKGAPLKISEPVVSFCETVSEETDMDIIAKSPNKHNRIYLRAQPLGDDLVKAINDGDIRPEGDVKERAKLLVEKHGWNKDEAVKLWTFGCPPDAIPNVLVDATKGVQYLNEIKDSMVGGFIQATAAGIICEEAMNGTRFNLVDMTMHADAIHRGAGQIMPPCKRAMYACQIKSGPRILEPLYRVDITVPNNQMSGVYNTLNQRRGVVETTEERPGTPLVKVCAFLPVLESFGFTQLLRQNTSGTAFPQMIFSHWDKLNGNPMEEGSQAHQVVMDVRKRKGMKMELPKFNDYYDKL